jgi:hypothetical protein
MIMKKTIGLFAVLAAFVVPSVAHADPVKVGGDFSLGVPSGLGVGVAVQPGVSWLRAGLSFQDNYVSPGGKASVVWSPIKFPVFPELQLDAAFFAREQLPFAINGTKNLNLQYNYGDLMLNLGVGNRDKAMFLLSGGASYIDANVGGLGASAHISNAFFSNPDFRGFIPSARLGVVVFFN